MALDPTLITGLATAGATVVAAGLMRVGRRRTNGEDDDSPERTAVSLTKQLMYDQRRDLDRARKHITELEAECERLREERDQFRHELDYAHVRIAKLGGP